MQRIGILGVGYVGAPLARAFAKAHFSVIGFDVDAKRVRVLKQDRIQPAVTWTADGRRLSSCNTFIICVPTPLSKKHVPDLRALKTALRTVARYAAKGSLIVVESTTYPGATRELLLPLLEQKGLRPEIDVCIAVAPERIDPGNKMYTLTNTPRVIGGIGTHSKRRAVTLYRTIVKNIHPVSSLEAAEYTKLLENSFRFVNISFMNEMAQIAEKLNLDIWEILDAAATKPFAFLRHDPGPGVGGHCIPVDPLYLQYALKKKGTLSLFIGLADKINQTMTDKIIARCKKVLDSLKRKQILLIGMTYKPNVDDLREAPSLKIAEVLLEEGAIVHYHDPLIPTIAIGRKILHSIPLTKNNLALDLVLILTPHDGINWNRIKKYSQRILDPRGVLREKFQ